MATLVVEAAAAQLQRDEVVRADEGPGREVPPQAPDRGEREDAVAAGLPQGLQVGVVVDPVRWTVGPRAMTLEDDVAPGIEELDRPYRRFDRLRGRGGALDPEQARTSDERQAAHLRIMPGVSEADSALIRASYEALNRGEVEAALAALHRDAVWRESPQLPGGDVFHGREEISDFLTGFLEQWQVFHQTVESTVANGDRICALIHLTAVGRGSGAQVDARYAHLWTLRDGLGAEVDAYYDPEVALAELRGEE